MIGFLRGARMQIGRLSRKPVILMYHRIAEPAFDPWGLAVSPARFEDQLAMLNRRRSPMGMDELADRCRRRRLPADTVAVTFDDGYLDNLKFAKPRLEAAGIPATVFITTGRIGCPDEFWWDELARIVLGSQAAVDIWVPIGAQCCRLHFTGAPEEVPRPTWRAWSPPATAREAAYLELWRKLQACQPEERQAGLSHLRALPSGPVEDDSRAMDRAEIIRLASGCVSVGAHGVNHQPLPSLALDACEAEIRQSGETCRSITGQPVQGFAFPHGAADDTTRRLVAQAGYRWACSTESRSMRPGDDPYSLPRLQVGEWDGEQLSSAMRALAA
jgi:peptidoglycan/xylan/chitin deacetylase (PgdA/CDA1 family)